jgi:hypothetical protein
MNFREHTSYVLNQCTIKREIGEMQILLRTHFIFSEINIIKRFDKFIEHTSYTQIQCRIKRKN